MHVSTLINSAQFDVTIDGEPIASTAVMPEWNAQDRLGIVVCSPYGALHASLLLQLAAAQFYDARPAAREQRPQYPQIYLFHVGRPWGDFSVFDVWPARHEVVIPAADPYRLLGEINDRAITRLAIPEVAEGTTDYALDAASGWTDANYAEDHLTSVLLYGITAPQATDIRIATTSAALVGMCAQAVDVARTTSYFESRSDQELVDMEVGPSTAQDIRRWVRTYRARAPEVSDDDRREVLASLGGERVEQLYRRSTAASALRMLPALTSGENAEVRSPRKVSHE